jgi:hypothetical protein
VQDLEDLIAGSVDTSKADYAVITGIQVHNWGLEYESEEPNLEWVDPRCVYVVVDGNRTDLDLHAATVRSFFWRFVLKLPWFMIATVNGYATGSAVSGIDFKDGARAARWKAGR